jgi:hypothetical protein
MLAGRVEFAVWGTTALLVVEDSAGLAQAQRILRAELAAVDAACSRFRSDSEISVLQAHAGTPQRVSPLLGEAITVALRAAHVTGGLVDPTVGAALRGLGYDRDFAALSGEASAPAGALRPAPGWWRVDWDSQRSRVLLPRGSCWTSVRRPKHWLPTEPPPRSLGRWGVGYWSAWAEISRSPDRPRRVAGASRWPKTIPKPRHAPSRSSRSAPVG